MTKNHIKDVMAVIGLITLIGCTQRVDTSSYNNDDSVRASLRNYQASRTALPDIGENNSYTRYSYNDTYAPQYYQAAGNGTYVILKQAPTENRTANLEYTY